MKAQTIYFLRAVRFITDMCAPGKVIQHLEINEIKHMYSCM